MIEAKNIGYTISGRPLLQDISVSFLPGKMNLIVGPNGAGKSTFIKLLSGQLKPTSGLLTISGVGIEDIPSALLAKNRAVLSQNIDISFPLTVAEVVMMGRYPHFSTRPAHHDHQAVSDVMHRFNIAQLASRSFNTLSGGEKQRVHFARVLAQLWGPSSHHPKYLLLDEPLTFLDMHYQFSFVRQLVGLLGNQDLTIVGVIHDLSLAYQFADQVTMINNGKMVANGVPAHVLCEQNIKAVFQLQPAFLQDGDVSYLLLKDVQ